MIILGIDPGTATVGFAVIKKLKDRDQKPMVVDFGCITTSSALLPGERLVAIHHGIEKLIAKHQPQLISIESLFFFKNLKTALPVSQAKGVIMLAAAQKRIPTVEFTPLQVKMTVVGYGKADKRQVQEMTKQLLNFGKLDLKEKHRKKDDAFDALGVALCATLHQKWAVEG